VRGSLNAAGAAGDDDAIRTNERIRDLFGDVYPIGGRSTRPGDCNSFSRVSGEQGSVTFRPQHVRCAFPKIIHRLGPLRIARYERPKTMTLGHEGCESIDASVSVEMVAPHSGFDTIHARNVGAAFGDV
jgi:hypothetical protein